MSMIVPRKPPSFKSLAWSSGGCAQSHGKDKTKKALPIAREGSARLHYLRTTNPCRRDFSGLIQAEKLIALIAKHSISITSKILRSLKQFGEFPKPLHKKGVPV
jgi:hypothetical protein